MANLQETNQWEAGVYQLETTDPVEGGAEGIDNLQAKQLANRTAWLKAQLTLLTSANELLTKLKTVDGSGSGLNADMLDGKHASAFLLASAYTANDILTKLKTVDGSASGLDADKLDGKHASDFLLASAYTASDILTKLKTVDGSASGLDADKLDGKHASDFLLASAYTANDILTKLKTVDGAGTGLDADTVDGIQGTRISLLDALAKRTATLRLANMVKLQGETLDGSSRDMLFIDDSDQANIGATAIPLRLRGSEASPKYNGSDIFHGGEIVSMLTKMGQVGGTAGSDFIKIPFEDAGVKKKLIIQWGTIASLPANTATTYTLPTTFPTTCLNAQVTPVLTSRHSSGQVGAFLQSKSVSSITIRHDDYSSNKDIGAHYIAIGY